MKLRNRNPEAAPVLLLLLLAAILSACSEPTRNERLEHVSRLIQDGDYPTARIELLNLVQIDPTDAQAQQRLITVLLELGRLDEALRVYERALEATPRTPGILELGAEILLAQGRFGALRDAARDGELTELPELVRAYYLGEALLGLAAYDELAALLESSPTLAAPDLDELRVRLLMRQGELEEAAALLERTLFAYPAHAEAWISQGQVHLQRGDAEAAMAAFKSAESYAGPAARRLRLAGLVGQFEASLLMDDFAAAAAVVTRAGQLAPDAPLLGFMRARIAAGTGDSAVAIDTLNRVLPGLPGSIHVQALVELGTLYFHTGRNGLAEISLRRAIELDPRSRTAKSALLALQLARGNERGARAVLEELAREAPDSIGRLVMQALLEAKAGRLEPAAHLSSTLEPLIGSAAAAYATQGDVLLTTGHFEEAAAAYATAEEIESNRELVLKLYVSRLKAGMPRPEAILEAWLADHSDDVPVRLALAERFRSTGHKTDAAQHYEMVLSVEPDHVAALNNLAWIEHELGEEEAIAHARRAYELAPENPAIADTLGWLLVQAGDIDSGMPLIEKAAHALAGMPEVRYHLAYAHARAGDTAAAIEALDWVLENGDDPDLRGVALALASELQ